MTSAVAAVFEPPPRNADTLESATPMSTPAATPTKPPAMPPATVSDLKSSVATTVTDCDELRVPSWLIWAPLPAKADVVTWSSVTPTPPATPTNPPPALAERAKKFSIDAASMATPPMVAVSKSPPVVNLPSLRPVWPDPPACASTWLLTPMKASVSLPLAASSMAARKFSIVP